MNKCNSYICIVMVVFLFNLPVCVKGQLITPHKLHAPQAKKQVRPLSNFFSPNPDLTKNLQKNFKTQTGSNELFNFYQLPVDKMVCAVPNGKIIGHINLFRPKLLPGEVVGNMPNAIPELSLPCDEVLIK